MEEKRIFESIEDFRQNATPDDYDDLKNQLKEDKSAFKSKDNPNPTIRFHFSEGSARKVLQDAGYLTARKNRVEQPVEQPATQPAPAKEDSSYREELKMDDIKRTFERRSIMMTSEDWERLQTLYDRYPSRDKSYVLHFLLDFALTKLGV